MLFQSKTFTGILYYKNGRFDANQDTQTPLVLCRFSALSLSDFNCLIYDQAKVRYCLR